VAHETPFMSHKIICGPFVGHKTEFRSLTMHPLHEYLCKKINEMVEKHLVVVFYDPRNEFQTFFDRELREAGRGYGDLPRTFIGERLTFLARFSGSYFALRAAVEPIAALDKPEPLVIYIPGMEHDRQLSVLMELEKGGTCYEPQLKQIALNVLRKRFTDGQIDEMLRPTTVTYEDIVSFLAQGDEGKPASILRTIFDCTQSEALISRWIADESKDDVIQTKEAIPELLKLIETRLGLALPDTVILPDARTKTMRYVLVGEFRSDLNCEPPDSIGMVPVPSGKEQRDRLRGVANILRNEYSEKYVGLADCVASDLNLDKAGLDAACLGKIDTFRVEERRLLAYAGNLIAGRKYKEALGIVSERIRSYWIDKDVSRQAQWEACHLMAELGQEIERVRSDISQMGGAPAKWIESYAGERAWHRIDGLQRRLETWVAKMDEEPETEKALGVIRRDHEELLKKMADGFAKAFADAAWAITGILQQTHVYPDVVQTMGGRTAYFWVDALRFEMGVDLAEQLQGAKDITLRPAIASLPTITPVGMAALLPGASASFSVTDYKGKIAANVEDSIMPGPNERLKLLKAKVPDVFDITLGKLLGTAPSKLAKMLGEASLVVVRSQEIDFVGELDGDLLARQVMDTVIGNIARAVKKLAAAGIEKFVITGDHGHQFSIRKEEDMRTDNPGGNTIGIHRRCWIGHGGSTPTGTVRIGGAELGYATDLDFVFPAGLGIFKASGGLAYHHGGFSLQEIVIPVLSFRMPPPESQPATKAAAQLRNLPDKITNRTFGIRVWVPTDLFVPDAVKVKIVLISNNEQVGQAGMAVSAEIDRTTGVLRIKPGTEASVGLMLTRDDCTAVRIVILDPNTDAVIDQSKEIPVSLGV
jgi:hypothetical protein